MCDLINMLPYSEKWNVPWALFFWMYAFLCPKHRSKMAGRRHPSTVPRHLPPEEKTMQGNFSIFIYLFIYILETSCMNVSGQRNPPRTDLFPTLGHCARFPTLLSRESPERLTAQRLQFQVAPPGSAGGDGKAQCRRLPSGRAFPAGRMSGSSGCSGRSRQTGAQTEACRWSGRRSWNPPGPRTVQQDKNKLHGGWLKEHLCVYNIRRVFPAYPPLDVSIEELTLGDVDPVPCDGQFQLFIVRAGVHRRAVFTGYTHQGAPKSTRAVLLPCQLCEKWVHLPPTRALSRTVSKSFGPSCSPW